MNTTIFCTFDHQDLADLAIGGLKGIPGVRNIYYVRDRNRPAAGGATAMNLLGLGAANAGAAWGYTGIWETNHDGPIRTAPHPVTAKIVCDERAKPDVTRHLVNRGAHKIITTPDFPPKGTDSSIL